jgi:Flp pilus assembly protein TadD
MLGAAAIKYHYVLDRRPQDADALNNLGTVHLLNADYAAAIDTFRRSLAIAPRDALTRTNLAIALQQSGNLDEARKEAEQALRDDPNYAKARSVLQSIAPITSNR